MRCNNCLWFPMEELKENVIESLICPNCGHTHIESCPEPFIRGIYQEFMMKDDYEMTEEGINNWLNEREYVLSDNIYDNYQ